MHKLLQEKQLISNSYLCSNLVYINQPAPGDCLEFSPILYFYQQNDKHLVVPLLLVDFVELLVEILQANILTIRLPVACIKGHSLCYMT